MYPYVNSTVLHKDVPKNIKKFSDWRFFLLPPVSTTPVVHLELQISPRTFTKIWNGPIGILRGLGETDSLNNLKSNISWHCPFKLYQNFLTNLLPIYCGNIGKDQVLAWKSGNKVPSLLFRPSWHLQYILLGDPVGSGSPLQTDMAVCWHTFLKLEERLTVLILCSWLSHPTRQVQILKKCTKRPWQFAAQAVVPYWMGNVTRWGRWNLAAFLMMIRKKIQLKTSNIKNFLSFEEHKKPIILSSWRKEVQWSGKFKLNSVKFWPRSFSPNSGIFPYIFLRIILIYIFWCSLEL